MNTPQKVIDRIVEIKENNERISYRDVARKVNRELEQNLSPEDCKHIWYEVKNKVDIQRDILQDISDKIEEDKNYEVEDNNYVLYFNNKETGNTDVYKIPIELVDKIFNDYSKYGANLTGRAVQHKYKLNPRAWQLIKSRLGLYKDSHILSPLSMEHAEENGLLDEKINEVSFQNFEDRYTY